MKHLLKKFPPFITKQSKNRFRFVWPNFLFNKIWTRTFYVCICKEKSKEFADLPSFKTAKKFGSANRKNIGYANHKSANCHICRRSANVTFFLSPQICGFAICGPPTSANWSSVSTTPVVPVGKFTDVVVDTSSKFFTGVADTSGKISHRRCWYQWCTLTWEYLCEFS